MLARIFVFVGLELIAAGVALLAHSADLLTELHAQLAIFAGAIVVAAYVEVRR